MRPARRTATDAASGARHEFSGADYLRARGVLEATFAAYGGEAGNPRDTATVAERLNRDPAKVGRDPNWPAVEAILWFPIYGPQHDLVHWLARPLPKLGESKFVAPTGSNGTLWIPPETYAVARHVSVPLVVTEGPIKGMVLRQASVYPIAPVGVWTVAVKSEPGDPDEQEEGSSNDQTPVNVVKFSLPSNVRESTPSAVRAKLHPILQGFQLAGRKVFLAFDADRKQNPHVRHAEIRAWMALFTAGADVYQPAPGNWRPAKGSMTLSPAKLERTPPSNAKCIAGFSSRPNRLLRPLGIQTSRRLPWSCTAPRTTAPSSSCSEPSLLSTTGFLRIHSASSAAAKATVPPPPSEPSRPLPNHGTNRWKRRKS